MRKISEIAIQDTIETCYRSLGDLKQERYFRTWLIRILINKCIDIIRKNRRENPAEMFPDQGICDPALSNCEFEELMRSLDEKYRTSFFSIIRKDLKSARSHSCLIWKKIL